MFWEKNTLLVTKRQLKHKGNDVQLTCIHNLIDITRITWEAQIIHDYSNGLAKSFAILRSVHV